MTTVRLLIHQATPPTDLSLTRFGGLPAVPASQDFGWPRCRSCHMGMQFQGQLRLARPDADRDALVLLFMCQNDPGMCDEWEADGGGNAALVVPIEGLVALPAPAAGTATRATEYGAREATLSVKDYGLAREVWAENQDVSRREILGQVYGAPDWLQGDETPTCNHCKQPMRHVAQLEEGPDYRTAMNFGGGCAYVFYCGCGEGSAKLLWQQ